MQCLISIPTSHNPADRPSRGQLVRKRIEKSKPARPTRLERDLAQLQRRYDKVIELERSYGLDSENSQEGGTGGDSDESNCSSLYYRA